MGYHFKAIKHVPTMALFNSFNQYVAAMVVPVTLLTSCVSKNTYELSREQLQTMTIERDRYKTELDKQKEDVSKCLTNLGVANDEKQFCSRAFKETDDKYIKCQNGCMITEFDSFKQRTRDEYQAQLDGYKQTSSEECRVQIERVAQEATSQQSQANARIAKLEQSVKSSEADCESVSNDLVRRIEEAQKTTTKIGEELKGCYRDQESQAQHQEFRQVIQSFPFPFGQPQFVPQQQGVYRR